VAVSAVFFDVGETLVDETRTWERAADAVGVPRFTLMGVLGGLVARGEHHGRVWQILGVERPRGHALNVDFYPDALACLGRLREAGYLVGAVGNTTAEAEAQLRNYVDVVGSSARWRVEKPAAEFFERLVAEAGRAPAAIAYVGDRVDNDIEPALAAGMIAVHIRRGPWGYLQAGGERAHLQIASLSELPDALARV
jgi:HAD superfamily hydrolase (TIGR01509 family)